MLIAFWRSLGFPQRRAEALQVLGFVSSFLFLHSSRWSFRANFLAGSERSVCASGHDVYEGQVFGDRQKARVLRRPCLRDSPPSVALAREKVDDGMVAASVVRSRGPLGGVVGVRFTILFRLYAIFVSLLLVFWSK